MVRDKQTRKYKSLTCLNLKMAFASSIQKSQIPVGCQLCEVGNKINWKCILCNLLLCDNCKDRVHLKIAKDHKILAIKDIGKQDGSNETFTFSDVKCEEHLGQSCCLYCKTCNKIICLKCVAKVHNEHELIEEEDYNKGKVMLMSKQMSKIKFEISKEYITDLTDIHLIGVCSDGSMWIGDSIRSTLQHVILTENRTEVITSLNIQIFGMAKTHSNNFLVTTDSTKIKLINTVKGQITDSMYDVKPLYPICVHVTSDQNVIIGAKSPGENYSTTGRRVVVVLDQEGKQLKEYCNRKKRLFDLPRILTSTKHDKHFFNYPRRITSDSNGNICFVDWFSDDRRGQVVVLSPEGDILGIYTGHSDVNTNNNPFTPVGILTTPSDNIVVTDLNNHLLHILTNQGQIITYYNLRDMGILHPYSLALSTSGTIYIGCVNAPGSKTTTKAKLYELKFSGF
ncbi:uncharacterized protein LOC127720032 [Mytilus californianus]|uniref:uncharacterized protein LOC127720032 n=1 Tax=Mytilus californianus TaxID=6549 RepID=UPI0022481B8F|nr:uncharacterized protein LOC127720032 [Mytilus californianus]